MSAGTDSKLDIWKLPPVLLIQLKRFEVVQNILDSDEEKSHSSAFADNLSFRSAKTENSNKYAYEKNSEDVSYPINGLDLSQYAKST